MYYRVRKVKANWRYTGIW